MDNSTSDSSNNASSNNNSASSYDTSVLKNRPPHIELKLDFSTFNSRYILSGFYKLMFVKFTNSPSDNHIRLYCYALNSNVDLPRNIIGRDFVLSARNDGRISETVPADAQIFDDKLSMNIDLIREIFKNRPVRFRQLRLVPKTKPQKEGTEMKKDIETYEVYVDDIDSGVSLNPSPPFLTHR